MAGSGCLRTMLDRTVLGGGVVFGDPEYGTGHYQADDGRYKDVHGTVAGRVTVREHLHRNKVEGYASENTRGDQPLVQGGHDLSATAQLYEVGADDGGDDRDAAQNQGIGHSAAEVVEGDSAEQHGGDKGYGIGFEQVGGHTGTVADIVAHVVGNHGRVAGVILRNTGLDLTDQVGTDVSALGEDTAAQTGKDGDQRSAETEADQLCDHVLDRCARHQLGQDHVVTGNAQQSQTNHQHTGDGATLEGNVECFVDTGFCRFGGAHIGANRNEHADESGQSGEDRTDGKTNGGLGTESSKQGHEHDRSDHGDDGILALHVGAGAFLDGSGDLFHPIIALRQAQDPLCRNQPVDNRCGSAGQGKYYCVLFHSCNSSCVYCSPSRLLSHQMQNRKIVKGIATICQYIFAKIPASRVVRLLLSTHLL